MKRQESIEDYLETILTLTNRLNKVRSIDIVNEMGYTKPSVSIAMKNLREKNLIRMAPDGYITLTAEGEKLAKNVYERHTVLTEALVRIGVPEEIAMEDACRVEHDISEVTFGKIKAFLLH
ncbi:MAG: metal-dependent transcriptional regulator [Lachnospiraceae bacterium]